MELKRRKAYRQRTLKIRFNRTSVELKLQNMVAVLNGGHWFNRTSVELKLMTRNSQTLSASGFNRTSVELKLLQTDKETEVQVMGLIVPVWN